MLKISQFQVPQIKPRATTRGDMRQLGNYAIQLERQRLSCGLDVNDQPTKPLNPAYEKQKVAAGQPPIRNNVLTGRMMGARAVVSVDQNTAEIGFTDARFEREASVNEQREGELGLSPSDQRKHLEKLKQIV